MFQSTLGSQGKLMLLLQEIFLKWAIPGLFFVYFCLLMQTLQFLQQINMKKCPTSMWRWDLNPWPLKHESPLITTRPGFQLLQEYLSPRLLRNRPIWSHCPPITFWIEKGLPWGHIWGRPDDGIENFGLEHWQPMS